MEGFLGSHKFFSPLEVQETCFFFFGGGGVVGVWMTIFLMLRNSLEGPFTKIRSQFCGGTDCQ